jgi:hypothetical protein
MVSKAFANTLLLVLIDKHYRSVDSVHLAIAESRMETSHHTSAANQDIPPPPPSAIRLLLCLSSFSSSFLPPPFTDSHPPFHRTNPKYAEVWIRAWGRFYDQCSRTWVLDKDVEVMWVWVLVATVVIVSQCWRSSFPGPAGAKQVVSAPVKIPGSGLISLIHTHK